MTEPLIVTGTVTGTSQCVKSGSIDSIITIPEAIAVPPALTLSHAVEELAAMVEQIPGDPQHTEASPLSEVHSSKPS